MEITGKSRFDDYVLGAWTMIVGIGGNKWKCQQCGHVQVKEGDRGPNFCPSCKLDPFFVDTKLVARLRK